jgi:hypothetical protein
MTLIDTLDQIGLGTEQRHDPHAPGGSQSDAPGGVYHPADIEAAVRRYVQPSVIGSMLEPIAPHMDSARRLELLHCFDVALGAAALTHQIASDPQAQAQLGIRRELDETDIVAALISGIYHDLNQTIPARKLDRVVPQRVLARIVAPQVLGDGPHYNKDDVDDTIRGAIMLGTYGSQGPSIDAAIRKARRELLHAEPHSLRPNVRHEPILGYHSAEMVLDAVAYHDGNEPMRWELGMLVGDRLALAQWPGKAAAIAHGVSKQVGYTDGFLRGSGDPGTWYANMLARETGGRQYLSVFEAALKKKEVLPDGQPNFLNAIAGTRTEEYVRDTLLRRGVTARTLTSPAFWEGIDEARGVLEDLKASPYAAGNAEGIAKLDHRVGKIYQMFGHLRPK